MTLGLGGCYLVLQAFLTGGLVSVFRRPRGGWTLRGLVHGCGFYFGRMPRLSLLALVAAGLLFALDAPVRRGGRPRGARGGLGAEAPSC